MQIKGSTILLTGGAGFIGSHVLDALIKQGVKKVVVVDDFNNYYDSRFKEENVKDALSHSVCELIRGDITDFELMERVYKQHQFDAVIHLAARAGVRPSIADPRLYQRVNIEGTQNIFELARQYGVKKIVYASSSSVYGNQKKTPFSETDVVNSPISPYAMTKRACELLAYTYYHLFKIRSVGLRFFTVYGERGRPDMAPYLFTEKILKGEEIQKFGDGSSRRDYTYIADIVAGVIKAAEAELECEVVNLGNNQPVSLNEFIKVLEAATGKAALIRQMPMQAGDVEQTFADITKAKTLLGWEPKTSFTEGISRFVQWYKEGRIA